MGGRESLAQAFTLLSFLSAGLIGVSSLPIWQQSENPSPEESSSELTQAEPDAEVPNADVLVESSNQVVPMGTWILSSLAKLPQSAFSHFEESDLDTSDFDSVGSDNDATDNAGESRIADAAPSESSSRQSSLNSLDGAIASSVAPIRTNASSEGMPVSSSDSRSRPFSNTSSSSRSRSVSANQTPPNRTALDMLPLETRGGQSAEGSSSFPSTQPTRSSQDLSSTTSRESRPSPPAAPPIANRQIVVDLSDRQVTLYHNNQLQFLFPIAIGRVGWETPTGQFEVIEKRVNPVWQNPLTDEIIEPGPNNPLGVRWIAFWSDGKNQLGFHGTNQSELIGQAVSHGCIRMRNEDIERFYDAVAMGTPVLIQP